MKSQKLEIKIKLKNRKLWNHKMSVSNTILTKITPHTFRKENIQVVSYFCNYSSTELSHLIVSKMFITKPVYNEIQKFQMKYSFFNFSKVSLVL